MDLMAIRRGLLAIPNTDLPKEYKRVKYLESTGTQWIALGKTLSTIDYSFFYELSPTAFNSTEYASSNYNGIMGRNSAPQVGFNSKWWTVGNAGSQFPYVPVIGQTYFIEYSKNYDGSMWVDGYDTGLKRTGVMTCNLFWVEGKPDNSKVKLYKAYCKNKNGEYEYNLVPCIRKSDIKPGMYDIVSKTFYTNSGTGEFIVPV